MAVEFSEGDWCPHCATGRLRFDKVEDCSCHISPPCGSCVNNPLRCDTCGEDPYEENEGTY